MLYFAAASRPTVKNLLNRKLEKTKAPVYNYLFAWEYPINGGITAFHCSELAFCFHALGVPQIKNATGGGPVALALQDKVSQAWINFAKTGNPSSARPRVEALHEGRPAGDGVRYRQPVGLAPRRQAGVAAAAAGRTRCAGRSWQHTESLAARAGASASMGTDGRAPGRARCTFGRL